MSDGRKLAALSGMAIRVAPGHRWQQGRTGVAPGPFRGGDRGLAAFENRRMRVVQRHVVTQADPTDR